MKPVVTKTPVINSVMQYSPRLVIVIIDTEIVNKHGEETIDQYNLYSWQIWDSATNDHKSESDNDGHNWLTWDLCMNEAREAARAVEIAFDLALSTFLDILHY